MAKLYSKLRSLMAANGYTQSQLARAIGIPYGTLCKRMTGVLQFNMDEVYRITDLFGVPHNQLHLIFPPAGKAEAAKNNEPISSIPHVIHAKYVLKEIEELE